MNAWRPQEDIETHSFIFLLKKTRKSEGGGAGGGLKPFNQTQTAKCPLFNLL